MHRRLFDIYQRRRIININVNIISAGVLALGLTLIPIYLTRKIGITDKVTITAIGTAFDMIFDVLIYYMLHWVANHWRPRWAKKQPKNHQRKFFKDATLIQFERALFAPLYYLIFTGVNYASQRMGLERELALACGFIVGIAITRVAHTLWGLKTGRFKDDLPQQTNDEAPALDQSEVTNEPSDSSATSSPNNPHD